MMEWTQMDWFSWCKTRAAPWRDQFFPDRGGVPLQAAGLAPGMLNPGRVSPRHCLRISWWHVEPTHPTTVPVCCAVSHQGSWAHQKVANSCPALTANKQRLLLLGHVKPPKEPQKFSVISDSSIASSRVVPRFLLWLEMACFPSAGSWHALSTTKNLLFGFF